MDKQTERQGVKITSCPIFIIIKTTDDVLQCSHCKQNADHKIAKFAKFSTRHGGQSKTQLVLAK